MDKCEQPSDLKVVYALLHSHYKNNADTSGLLEYESVRQTALIAKQKQSAGSAMAMILRSGEEEKMRIAQDLHDGLGQLLTSINLHVQQCLKATHRSEEAIPENLCESLNNISAMTKQAMSEVRGLCGSLRPAILDDLGVLAAIKWQCRMISQVHEQLKVTMEFDIQEAMIPESRKTAIYRIVQEALNNSAKYAKAKNLLVRICQIGDSLKLVIKDDGVGFDCKDVIGGMGMISMRQRAESIGGLFDIQSSPGRGVEICVVFPERQVVVSG